MMAKVFVYGTLKQGHYNNRLLTSAQYLGTAKTITKYSMIDVGFPVILPSAGGHVVAGEVYEVDEETLARLDRLEAVGTMYDRVSKFVRMTDGPQIKVFYYVGIAGQWEYGDPVEPNGDHFDWSPSYGRDCA